ncbi:thioredoxin [Cadophora sp. DSE1049]|nr:thioredoxin [Cadophora sp. DSE1049]
MLILFISNSEFDTLVDTPDKLVVVDFSAEWCGPCRFIAPKFASVSNEYPQAVFVHVDIDKLSTLPEAQNIRSVPTFRFYKNQSRVAEFAGANENMLKDTIKANL